MSSMLATYKQSQDRQHPDEWRLALKERILSLLKDKNAEVDLIKQSRALLNKYPDLASLKSRIKYPEEIAKVNVKDLTDLLQDLDDARKTTHQIGTELLKLADYYRSFESQLVSASAEIRAKLLIPKAQVEGDLLDGPYDCRRYTARRAADFARSWLQI